MSSPSNSVSRKATRQSWAISILGPRAQYQNIDVIVLARKSGIGRAVARAARINCLRFAAIDMPMPVLQIRTPLSALPSPIADEHISKSGNDQSGLFVPRSRTSRPASLIIVFKLEVYSSMIGSNGDYFSRHIPAPFQLKIDNKSSRTYQL